MKNVTMPKARIMKKFSQLFLKCHDASVFQEKNNFEILSKVYFDDNHSKQVLEQDQYFIIGEKGTGKTMIAQYLSNIRTDKNCTTIDFSTIDFETFRKLSEDGYLERFPINLHRIRRRRSSFRIPGA
ncbi:hypothetical protein P1J78_05925 [Psychromarinibacter sp. C21-152]|uniref:Uncharacterized protein n=1 Tax=Psychromarinibacter sediminicola TaxID=3033385 RepID=A0AAE3NPX0_9RHOB|nr:hypothetical protein [Psychromarinibacter sediminicola]MDF0600261.1 hypothetical protein [Psychromarinibacter sediminicola]